MNDKAQLQIELSMFNDKLKKTLFEVVEHFDFTSEFDKEYIEEVQNHFASFMKNNGSPIINELCMKLENKYLDYEYSKLFSIITYHEYIAHNVLDRYLTEDRIEMVYNYIQEAPSQLSNDLELDNLPDNDDKTKLITDALKRAGIKVEQGDEFPKDHEYSGIISYDNKVLRFNFEDQ